MQDVTFSTKPKHVFDNLLRLYSYALGTAEQRAFHFDRVFNAEHQVYHMTPEGVVFAPVKWCGAKSNSIENYSWKKLPYAGEFQRALTRIGFKKLSKGQLGYDRVYEQFIDFCRSFEFKDSTAGVPHSDSRSRTFWLIGNASSATGQTFPDDVTVDPNLIEGATKTILVNAFERSAKARLQCIAHYGWLCQACGIDFEKRYGGLGTEFIHVHHLRPLSSLRKEYAVDPIADLRPVCPNCHAMIHRHNPPITIEELQKRITPA